MSTIKIQNGVNPRWLANDASRESAAEAHRRAREFVVVDSDVRWISTHPDAESAMAAAERLAGKGATFRGDPAARIIGHYDGPHGTYSIVR